MTPRDEIVQQAMALPPEDRAYVADMLEQSLSGGGFATPEIAAAWATPETSVALQPMTAANCRQAKWMRSLCDSVS